MSQTTTPSGAAVDVPRFTPTISDYPAGHFEDAEAIMAPCMDGDYIEYTAVAALIARNAEIEAERGQLSIRADIWKRQAMGHVDQTQELRTERDALAAENKALHDGSKMARWLFDTLARTSAAAGGA